MKFGTDVSDSAANLKKKRFVRIEERTYFKLKISPYFLITVILNYDTLIIKNKI